MNENRFVSTQAHNTTYQQHFKGIRSIDEAR